MKSESVYKVEHTGLMALTVEDNDSDVLIVSRDASPSQHDPHDIAQDVMPNETTTVGRSHRRTFF